MTRLNLSSLRHAAPILLGAFLFAMGLYALYHLLKPVNPADVAAQIRAIPVTTLMAALFATAVGYVALIFYDWFGLRFIGRTLNGGIVALGGFLGYECVVLPAPHDPAMIAELRDISDAWLGGKTGREKGFSGGRFDPDYLMNFDISVVRKNGRIVAFANILSASKGRYVAVDLMRYLPEEASGLMEYMFLCLIEHYKAQGAAEFSLGTAPLSGLSERSVSKSWNQFGRLIYRHGGAFYNFEGLRGESGGAAGHTTSNASVLILR